MAIFNSYVKLPEDTVFWSTQLSTVGHPGPWTSPGGPGPLTLLDGDAVDGKLVSRLASSYGNALEDCEGVAWQRG